MTDPDPDKRPQKARDVVALLAESSKLQLPKPDPKAEIPKTRALERIRPAGPPARRIFPDVPEPLGTFLRLGVLGFGASGWLAMAATRASLFLVITIAQVLAFPARKNVKGVGTELDSMLSEGQGGFTDMMRGAMARR
jgi:hypothetical protein